MSNKNDDKLSDEEIVKRVLRGEINLFRKIIGRYQQKMFNIGVRFYRNHDDASDFCQEVFIRTYNKLSTYRGKSRFYSWLIKVAYNYGINSIKEKKTEEIFMEETIIGNASNPEKLYLKNEIISAISTAMKDLPYQYRVCLDLFFFFGLTYEEVGNVTGLPVNTIKSHVHRAKAILRDSLRGTVAEDYNEM